MNFIKKIFDGKIDENVHLQFQKFSKGEFRNRAMIRAKQSKGKYTINTSAEFANEIVRIMAEKIRDKKVKVTGAIISTSDLTKEIEFKEKKQFQGVKKYIIEKEMSGKEIIELLNKFQKSFFALSFGIDDSSVRIKPKAPTSGKPAFKGRNKSKPDFCKLVTTDKKIGESFIFEKPDFKEADVNHQFIIEELILPDFSDKEKDFAKIREMAKRKGKIVREAEIDGKKMNQEFEFEV